MTTLQRFADPGLKTALWLIGFLPFLNPVHTWPIPSFYSEWLAGVLALFLIACSVARSSPPTALTLPSIVLLPLGLTAAILIQIAFDHVAHPRYAILYCGFLLLAAILTVVAGTESRRLGLERIAGILASAFTAGALLQASVLLLQRASPEFATGHFPAIFGAAAGGILGQRNHLVDYLWLGIASASYLLVRQHISLVIGTAVISGLAIASLLPGSRSAYLYPLGLAAVAALAGRRGEQQLPWRRVAVVSLLTIPLMLTVDQMPRTATQPSPTAAERLGEATSELDPVRSGLLQVAWQAAMARPFSGHGIGAAPSVTFAHADTWPNGTRPVVAEHFHNLFAQWLVEFGFPLTVVAAAFLLYWLVSALCMAQSAEHWWLLSMLAVIGLHSQLEYPLWLAYFLIPAAILAGASGRSLGLVIELRSRHLLVAVAGIVAAAFALASLLTDYRQLEIVAAASGPGASRRALEQGMEAALAIERNSLLAPQAIVLMAGAMGISREGAASRRELCRQALRISPTRDVALKCPAVAALNGEGKEATRLLSLGNAVYGNNPSWPALQAEFPELRKPGTVP